MANVNIKKNIGNKCEQLVNEYIELYFIRPNVICVQCQQRLTKPYEQW